MSVDGVFDMGFVEIKKGTICVVAHWRVTVAFPAGDVRDEGVSCVVNILDPRGDGIGVA